MKIAAEVNYEQLYNSIDHHGVQFYGPVEALIKELEQSGKESLNLGVWMAMHELSHIFKEGGDLLVM